jgi:hypothetical protein
LRAFAVKSFGEAPGDVIDVIDALHAAHPDGVDAVLDIVNGSDAIRRDAEIIKWLI